MRVDTRDEAGAVFGANFFRPKMLSVQPGTAIVLHASLMPFLESSVLNGKWKIREGNFRIFSFKNLIIIFQQHNPRNRKI